MILFLPCGGTLKLYGCLGSSFSWPASMMSHFQGIAEQRGRGLCALLGCKTSCYMKLKLSSCYCCFLSTHHALHWHNTLGRDHLEFSFPYHGPNHSETQPLIRLDLTEVESSNPLFILSIPQTFQGNRRTERSKGWQRDRERCKTHPLGLETKISKRY